jgi:hypothetical protein
MSSIKKFKLPCGKRHFETAEDAHNDLQDLIVKKSLTDHKLIVYRCEDCSTSQGKIIWHYGNVGKNGKVRVRLPGGGHKKFRIENLVKAGQSRVF